MKKSFKLIALILAVAMLAVTLCSCRALDDAKENRAVYTSTDHTEIEFKGNIYRQINLGKYEFLDYGIGGLSDYVYDKDIPILIRSWYGEWMYVGNNEAYIQVDDYDYGPRYLREDLYDTVKKAAESAKLDCYYFEYWSEIDYDNLNWDEYDSAYDDSYHSVMLDDDASKIVDNALNVTANDKISYKELSDYHKIIRLGTCDSNMILTNQYTDFYLVKDKETNYYFWNGDTHSDYCLVKLNEADSRIVSGLFSNYHEAISDEKVSWLFNNYYYDYDYEYEYEDTYTNIL